MDARLARPARDRPRLVRGDTVALRAVLRTAARGRPGRRRGGRLARDEVVEAAHNLVATRSGCWTATPHRSTPPAAVRRRAGGGPGSAPRDADAGAAPMHLPGADVGAGGCVPRRRCSGSRSGAGSWGEPAAQARRSCSPASCGGPSEDSGSTGASPGPARLRACRPPVNAALAAMMAAADADPSAWGNTRAGQRPSYPRSANHRHLEKPMKTIRLTVRT